MASGLGGSGRDGIYGASGRDSGYGASGSGRDVVGVSCMGSGRCGGGGSGYRCGSGRMVEMVGGNDRCG